MTATAGATLICSWGVALKEEVQGLGRHPKRVLATSLTTSCDHTGSLWPQSRGCDLVVSSVGSWTIRHASHWNLGLFLSAACLSYPGWYHMNWARICIIYEKRHLKTTTQHQVCHTDPSSFLCSVSYESFILMCMHMYTHAQSCLTLCDPMDCSPPGSSVHGISKQEYWSGLPFPTPGDLPNPGVKPTSPMSPALAGGFVSTEPPCHYIRKKSANA